MRIQLPVPFREVIAQNHGLHRYLESLLEERPFTERSWLYDGKHGSPYAEPDALLEEWEAQLASLKDGNEFEQAVYEFDISQKEKWGPQGGHEPLEQILDSVVLPSFNPPAFSKQPLAFSTPEWHLAIASVIAAFRKARVWNLRPRSYARVVDTMRGKGTLISNSGWPDFTRRSNPEVKQNALNDATSGKWEEYPAILLFRRYRGKTRQVWMFPMSANIVEASWFQPLEEAILASPTLADQFFSPWKGFESVRERISKFYAQGKIIAASDFSSTDAHFQLSASEEVLKVLTAIFQPQYKKELERSVRHMHTIPLIIGPDSMLVGEHGVSSGSNWTNFIETVFDFILGQYEAQLTKARALFGIGDDMAHYLEAMDQAFPEQLAKIGTSVGQVIKAEKTMCEPNKVKSLQRLFQRGYKQEDSDLLRGVYSTVRALMSSVYPERSHDDSNLWNGDMFCARQFMILENCCDHPLFHEFVRFICKGDPRLVPFAKKSDKALARVTREAKLIPGLNPTYNQEREGSSLAIFKSIEYAREIA